MFDEQPLDEQERFYKWNVMSSQCLRIIIKLPPRLLRGSGEAPLVLVFTKAPQKHRLWCLDLKDMGIRCSRNDARVITTTEFESLFSAYKDDEGYSSLFACYKGDTWNNYRPMEKMRIGSLDDFNELLVDGIDLDSLFFGITRV